MGRGNIFKILFPYIKKKKILQKNYISSTAYKQKHSIVLYNVKTNVCMKLKIVHKPSDSLT